MRFLLVAPFIYKKCIQKSSDIWCLLLVFRSAIYTYLAFSPRDSYIHAHWKGTVSLKRDFYFTYMGTMFLHFKISFTINHTYPLMTSVKTLVEKLKVYGNVISVFVAHLFIFCNLIAIKWEVCTSLICLKEVYTKKVRMFGVYYWFSDLKYIHVSFFRHETGTNMLAVNIQCLKPDFYFTYIGPVFLHFNP